jgi:major membrane immunogen (membrane-anchored lipoprotein)
MKKAFVCFAIALCLVILSSQSASSKIYKDGIYHGETRSQYSSENYWGNTFLFIKNNQIDHVEFYIIDKSVDEVFDQNYETNYKGNQTYIDQCRKDWSGLNNYIIKFNEFKDISKIDVISGATWSYNIFKDAIKISIDKAKIK